jgi:hypothetical protein
MVYHDERTLLKYLKQEYIETYEEVPEVFELNTKIYADLHANAGIGKAMVLEWLHHFVKRIGVDENILQGRDEMRDYTLKEIIEEVKTL